MKPLENMVGVIGFEPTTPASRTHVMPLKPAQILHIVSTIRTFLGSKCARVRKIIYACCVMAVAMLKTLLKDCSSGRKQ